MPVLFRNNNPCHLCMAGIEVPEKLTLRTPSITFACICLGEGYSSQRGGTSIATLPLRNRLQELIKVAD